MMSKSPWIALIATGLLASAPLVASARFHPSVLEGSRLVNTSVGYHGFEVDVPDDYIHVNPATKSPVGMDRVALGNAGMLGSFGRGAGINTDEIVPFKSQGSCLAVGIFALGFFLPQRSGYERLLLNQVGGLIRIRDGKAISRRVIQVNGRSALSLEFRIEPKGRPLSVILVVFPLQPKSIVMIEGLSTAEERDQNLKDVMAAADHYQEYKKTPAKT